MKLSKLLIFAVVVVLFSCKKEDPEPVCTQADWIGTYGGTAVCDGNTDDTTVTITASGTDAIVIRYVAGNTTTIFDPLTVSNCDVENTESAGGVTGSVSASLDGDSFTLRETLTGGGFNTNCMVTATRQ